MLTAGQPITAADLGQAQSDTQSTSGTTTSTSYTSTLTGGTACGVAFVAPASGAVLIISTCQISNSGANNTRCSFVVRTGAVIGSGSSVLAADDSRAQLHNGTTSERGSISHPMTSGLTPGSSYNVQQVFSVAGGTGTFSNKNLVVIPLL